MNEQVQSERRSEGTHTGLDGFDAVTIVAVLISFVAVAALPFAPKKFGDVVFHVEAKALAAAIRGDGSWEKISFSLAPGPVLYYAIPYVFVPRASSDDTYWLAAFLWTVGCMVLSFPLFRRTAEKIAGRTAGKIAAIATVASPFAVYYSYGINAEPMGYLGTILLAFGWASWFSRRFAAPISKGLLPASIGFALFVLAKPNGLLLVPLALVAAVALWLTKSDLRRREARYLLACITIGGALVALVSVSVLATPGSRHGNSQIAYLAHTAFFGSFQFRTEPWDWRFWGRTTRVGSKDYAGWIQTQQELNLAASQSRTPATNLQLRWLISDILHHPGLRLRMIAVRILALHVALVNSKPPESFRLGTLSGLSMYLLFHIIVNSVNAVVILAALYFLIQRNREWASYWALWGPWVVLVLFHAVTYAEARYVFPAQPGRIIMCGAALSKIVVRIKQSSKALPAPAHSTGS